MNRMRLLVAAILLVVVLVGTSACGGPRPPEGTLKVSELAQNPVYDTEVRLFGEVDYLGEVNCDCFDLTSGETSLKVWYDSMVEDDGSERPAVSVDGIENGDWVIVTGELKHKGQHRPQDAFWATSIEPAP
jgi:hypothetical protein